MPLTPEQKALRATGYGASEVAAVVGVGPGRLIDLYAAKVAPAIDEPDQENIAMELGSLLEEPIAKIYERRTGTYLAPVGTLRHPTRPLALATPDRARFPSDAARDLALGGEHGTGLITTVESLGSAERLVELKSTGTRYRRDYGPAGTGQVPEEKAIQAIWQMGVTGQRVVDMPVLFRGEWGVSVEIYTVAWNEAVFEWLYQEVERFHSDYVTPRRPPPPDGGDAYDEALSRLHPKHRLPSFVASEADEEVMLRYAKFRTVAHRADVLKKQAAQELKNRIGDAEGMLSAALGKLTWKRSADKTEVDWQKAAQDALALGGLVLNGLRRLRDDGAIPTPESLSELETRLKAIVPEATRVRPGYRSLRLYPKGEADLELARLQIAMDALTPGEE